MKTYTIECSTAEEAIRQAAAHPGHVAVLIGGQRMVIPAARAKALELAGASFAYICKAKGRFVTVPVNGER